MKKNKGLITVMALMTMSPLALPIVQNTPTVNAQVQQVQRQGQLALGASLSAAQAQQTIALLGAGNVTPQNTIYVDGTMINRYLNDGSNASTGVFSSAYIQPQAPGYGVQVQIVTPGNITAVSTTTYQNAAITAGAKDAIIKIGTITPVTGEGALTGLYALLEQTGVKLNPQNVQTAQSEITVVNKVKDQSKLSDEDVNKIITEIKKEVITQTQQQQQQGKQVNTTEIVNNVVNNVVNNTNINGDGNTVVNNNDVNTPIEIDNDTKQALEQYAENFAQTDAAKDEGVIQQLEASMNDEDWITILNGLEPSMTKEDILAKGIPDFSDTQKYHPILKAFYDRFFQIVKEDKNVEELYGQTFLIEILQPNLPLETRVALDELRTLMYQYAASFEPQYEQEAKSMGVPYKTIKEQWIAKYNNAEGLRTTDPNLAEIVRRTALATGFAPEVFTYQNFQQKGKVISFEVAWDTLTHQTISGRYAFDLDSMTLSQVDPGGQAVAFTKKVYDYQSIYGVKVENAYQENPIDPQYTIPGYVPEETTVESTTTTQEQVTTVIESTTAPTTEDPSMTPTPDAEPTESTAVDIQPGATVAQ